MIIIKVKSAVSRSPIVGVAIIVLLSVAAIANAQKSRLAISYSVGLTNIAAREFHVTTEIDNIDQPRLDLSLPTWTPGWYTVENYGRNLLRFTAVDDKGNRLPLRMSRKQTWNIDTRGKKRIRIEYDYQATVLGLNQAKIADDWAFFTGIELFLQPEGHRDAPSTVRFSVPAGWKLITALKETADPNVFTADNYDTLVDAPVEMGNFDVTKFEVEGKPHYFVATPAGTFSAEKSKRFTDMLAKVAVAEKGVFGELPYSKYVYFYFFTPPESNASGALEHLNSFVSFAPPGDRATPEQLIGTAAHEFFHLWNVKRLRPAGMWPYDYSRENETPLLWFSEGFTNYYGALSVYRAGLMDEKAFLARVAGAAAGVEGNEVRNYVSPANASVSTWVGYDTPVAFGISYYTQGQNLGALLDLSIRHDSGGKASLDDVLRTLYRENYQRGRGFTIDDMLAVIKRLTKQDYADFFDRYIYGTDVPDYDRIFGYAGYRIEKTKHTTAVFGWAGRVRNSGFVINSIRPETPAAEAGLHVGDIVMSYNGVDVYRAEPDDLAGQDVKLKVKRGDQPVMDVTVKTGSRQFESYSLVATQSPTAEQLAIRQGWLKR